MKPPLLAGITRLSDDDLLSRTHHLAQQEREATASLVAHLAEIDERSLHLARGYSSLGEYCVEVLHYSEGSAWKRIRVARTARRYPLVLRMLAACELSLATVELLASHLTSENQAALLGAARFKSKRQVEALLADLRPLPDVAPMIRKLPTQATTVGSNRNGTASANAVPGPELAFDRGPGPAGAELAGADATETAVAGFRAAEAVPEARVAATTDRPGPRPVIAPLGAARYRIQFTANAETHDKLRLAQALLRHAIPDGDLGAIVDRALTVLLAQLEKTKLAATNRPRPSKPTKHGSRHIPAALTRDVWARDERRCTFTGPDGRRCSATGFLEVDHVHPFGARGEASVENLRILCRAHNRYAAEVFFGAENVQRRIETKKQRARKRNGGSDGFPARETSFAYGLGIRARPRVGETSGPNASPGAG